MSSHHQTPKNGFIFGIIFGALVFLLPPPAVSEENADPILRFPADRAFVFLWPDSASPFLSTGPTGLHFSPYDVSLLKKGNFWNSQIPELEPVDTYGAFFGLKITLKLEGGWNIFSGGDIEKGIGGLYDNAVAAISASGTPIMQNVRESSHAGLEAGGDLIYCITPRFGIGIGAAKVKAGKESYLVFQQAKLYVDDLRIRPEIRISALRAGLFYSFPFAGRLAISVHGGPALYSAEYRCSMGVSGGSYIPEIIRHGLINTGYFQKARAKQMGFEGGIGFEFNPNPFAAFFVEAQGRYAKIGGFEGEEEATFYQDNQYRTSVKTGPLYLVDTATYPQLGVVPPEGAVAGSARKATLDFSGVSFIAGLKLRF
jgi:hypothetical protein